jgi:hypothetical protein
MNFVRVVHDLVPRTSFLAAAMLLGCALPPTMQTSQVMVWARSQNRSEVDIYLLCGDRDAQWLGAVRPREAAALEFPYARTRCVEGLNFFLVARGKNRGYWVGPVHPQAGTRINLLIEKYAALSSANIRFE